MRRNENSRNYTKWKRKWSLDEDGDAVNPW